MAAIKGARGGRTGGGTGIGPGGGFGGSFGGGGSGFLGGGGNGFGGDMMQPRRKLMAQGANGAIPLSYTPTKDTVPAMLSPGEYVMNNRAMQLPGANNLMSALNAVGNGGYADGGMVLEPEMLVKILSMLAQFAGGTEDGGQMDAEGGQPQHFAWGGQVQAQRGGFGGGMGLGGPRMPSGGSGGPRMGGQPAVAQRPVYGRPSAPQAPSPATAAPGPFIPPSATGGGTTPQLGVPGNPSDMGSLYDLLRQYGQTGAFGPEGDPRIMQMVQANATSNADAMRARQQNQMALGGMDAGQAGSFSMQQQLRGQGDIANALNSAQQGQLQAQQQFGQQLFGNLAGLNMDEYRKWLDYVHQQRLGG